MACELGLEGSQRSLFAADNAAYRGRSSCGRLQQRFLHAAQAQEETAGALLVSFSLD
jgi:hypothetical protein